MTRGGQGTNPPPEPPATGGGQGTNPKPEPPATGAGPGTNPPPEPPSTTGERERRWVADHDQAGRDATAAIGTRGQPAPWQRARAGAAVALARSGFRDAQWSFVYQRGSRYAAAPADADGAVAAARAARAGRLDESAIQGPMINPPVWTWEIPLYFWFGGIAAGSSFIALACDLAGDHASARTARRVSLAALVPCPPLLISDLGRPERFANMLRIFKPRSPMSLGAWALTVFGNVGAAAVAADLLGRGALARRLGAVNALVGGYLGSYTGVLLASTAVPLWARSRLFLGPIFVATATATGAAATRLTLVATGVPVGHPTRTALGTVETGAMATELVLSTVNRLRLGDLADALERGTPGRVYRSAKWAVRIGLALRLARRRTGPRGHHVASALYLAGGLAFRFAWVSAGRLSAGEDHTVARMARRTGIVR